jgi:TPR repeat protein
LHDSPQQWAGQISGIENAKADKLESVRQACTNAVPALQRVLGEAYLNGNEVKKDEAEAVKWFRKAAEGGDTDGQRDLGHALAEGQGTKADLVEATRWLSAAAQKGDKAAKQELEALRGRASVKQVKREQQAAELGQ